MSSKIGPVPNSVGTGCVPCRLRILGLGRFFSVFFIHEEQPEALAGICWNALFDVDSWGMGNRVLAGLKNGTRAKVVGGRIFPTTLPSHKRLLMRLGEGRLPCRRLPDAIQVSAGGRRIETEPLPGSSLNSGPFPTRPSLLRTASGAPL